MQVLRSDVSECCQCFKKLPDGESFTDMGNDVYTMQVQLCRPAHEPLASGSFSQGAAITVCGDPYEKLTIFYKCSKEDAAVCHPGSKIAARGGLLIREGGYIVWMPEKLVVLGGLVDRLVAEQYTPFRDQLQEVYLIQRRKKIAAALKSNTHGELLPSLGEQSTRFTVTPRMTSFAAALLMLESLAPLPPSRVPLPPPVLPPQPQPALPPPIIDPIDQQRHLMIAHLASQQPLPPAARPYPRDPMTFLDELDSDSPS